MAIKTYYLVKKYIDTSEKNLPFYIEDASGLTQYISLNTQLGDATNIEFSTDNVTWSATQPTLPANGKVYIRANATHWGNDGTWGPCVSLSQNFKVGGNIMSLLYGSNFSGAETSFPDSISGVFYCFLYNNPNLVSVEKLALPATVLNTRCYCGMFGDCTALTDTPSLPATTLATECYCGMFSGCTSLTTPPILAAMTMVTGCYLEMFAYSALTSAPALPATTLAEQCYQNMFLSCTSLNSITCLATDISASGCTTTWLSGVAATGTFTKAASMSSWTTGDSGIPSGWTVQDA